MLTEDQKERARIAQRAYYQRNKETALAKTRAYMAANPDKKKSYDQRYYDKNRDKIIARMSAYGQTNKARLKIYHRKYRGLPVAPYPAPEFCECCGCLPGPRGLVLDHCHETGAFRGWLCDSCNLGLGKIGDTLEAARNLVKYLETIECRTKSQSPAPEPPSTLET